MQGIQGEPKQQYCTLPNHLYQVKLAVKYQFLSTESAST